MTIPEVLREALGPDAARALAELLNQVGREMRDDVIVIAEEKFGRRLAEELAGTRAVFERRLVEELGGLRAEISALDRGLRADMAALESRLNDRMNGLLKWAFAFWAGQFVLLLGILLVLFRG